MHRLIMNCSDKKELEVDHIDGNGLNNQKHNLRICTWKENHRNRRKSQNKSSQYKGVSIERPKKGYKGYWVARIRVDDILIPLGRFSLNDKGEIEAAKAYDKAAIKYFGVFASLNFPKINRTRTRKEV